MTVNTTDSHVHVWVGIWELGDDTERLMCSECGMQRSISSMLGEVDPQWQ